MSESKGGEWKPDRPGLLILRKDIRASNRLIRGTKKRQGNFYGEKDERI